MNASSLPDPETTRRRKILSASGFAHFIHDGFTDAVYVLLPLWREAFGLSFAEVGILKTCVTVGLAGFQVPAGFLAERFGERAVLVCGTVFAGAGFILLAHADNMGMLAVFLFLCGVGCGTQHPLASALVSRAYDGGRRRAALGTYNFTGDLGKIVIPFSVAAIAGIAGWQTGAMVYGGVGIVAAIAIYLVLRHLDVGGPAMPELEKKVGKSDQRKGGWGGWGIGDRRGFSALSAISIVDCSSRFGFLTFLSFLLIEKGAETGSVGFAFTLVFAGGAAGKLICGLIAERVGILRTVVLTEIASVSLIIAVVYMPLLATLIFLPALGVVLNGTSSVLYGTVGDFVDPHRQARAFGLFYTFGVGAGAAAPFAYGLFSDHFGLTAGLIVLAASILLVLPLCLVLRPSLTAAEAAE